MSGPRHGGTPADGGSATAVAAATPVTAAPRAGSPFVTRAVMDGSERHGGRERGARQPGPRVRRLGRRGWALGGFSVSGISRGETRARMK